MYRCENCGRTFQHFKVAGQCPLCNVYASVRCEACKYTAAADKFIQNGDRCPNCGAKVSLPHFTGSSTRAAEPPAGQSPPPPQKTCPQCAEAIQLSALVCRYCGHKFSEAEVAAAEQQRLALVRLRDLHLNVAKAKLKANARGRALLLGGLAGVLALMVVTASLVYLIEAIRGSSEAQATQSLIPGGAGIAALVVAWSLTTVLLRRRAKRRAAVQVANEEATLKAAVHESARLHPVWASRIGGIGPLLNLSEVERLLQSRTYG